MKRLLFSFATVLLCSCGKQDVETTKEATEVTLTPYPVATASLPSDLAWITNSDQPTFASPNATKGGRLREFITSFPLTLRTVGPDSNGTFAGVTRGLNLSLTDMHPSSKKFLPSLAESWAFDKDGKTVYYKLDKDAKWSDGKSVTADDYIFALEFMRSKHIVAPWYNDHYSKEFDKIVKYDDYTIGVYGSKKKPDLLYYYGVSPRPRHYYRELDKEFVKKYNWEKVPNTGAYDIGKVRKGKSITLERKKEWWAKDKKFYKNRYNVDKIEYKVIRDMNTAWEHYKKGNLDTFALTLPAYWHQKSKINEIKNGYMTKLWFYNEVPQPDYHITLNMDKEIFKDKNIRYAFAHSMNIERVLTKVLRGDYERLESIATGYGKFSNTDVKARRFDLQKADEYFTKAGWDKRGTDGIRVKDGKRFSVTVTYGASHHQERLVVLKEEARKAGVELKLQLLDSATSFKQMLEKKHEIAWGGWGPGYRPQYWGQLHSQNAHKTQTNNLSNTDNKELDKLIDGYRNEFDEAERQRLSREIIALVHEDGAWIPTFKVPYFRETYWNWLKLPEGYATKSSLGVTSYDLYWIDENKKKEILAAKKSGKVYPENIVIYDKYKQ